MRESLSQRVDEVSRYYKPAKQMLRVRKMLYFVAATLSFITLYIAGWGLAARSVMQAVFIIVVIIHFAISETLRLYIVPRAERARRQQLLSDALGIALSHDRTSLYYNNEYSPSYSRLAANTMENALFGKEIAARMLVRTRFVTGGYLAAWIAIMVLRHHELGAITWITQTVFSHAILVQWLNLEVLHMRFEEVYDRLHAFFLHQVGQSTDVGAASILDALISYEAAKAATGVLLSSKVFEELNQTLSEKWVRIRRDLAMDVSDVSSSQRTAISEID